MSVHSSFAIIFKRKGKLATLLLLYIYNRMDKSRTDTRGSSSSISVLFEHPFIYIAQWNAFKLSNAMAYDQLTMANVVHFVYWSCSYAYHLFRSEMKA